MQQSIIIVEEETAHLQQLQSSPPPARQRQQSHPLQQQPSLYLRRRRPSDHATMPESHNHPSSSAVAAPKPAMTHEQLMDYVKGLLDAEQEREATSVGELRMETQTGSTLDLSHCNISALPVEVALYIKDRVERHVYTFKGAQQCQSLTDMCTDLRSPTIRRYHYPLRLPSATGCATSIYDGTS